ncbi:hypothetical protein QZN11_36215 [Streptomyces gramineus]|uniref:COG1470 family protein n=1 Tax=Streptomyces gramineus TaxID=910542 RepID=UPI00398BABE3
MGATVLLQEYDTFAQPGEVTRRTVQILNTGPVVDRFELDIVGDAAGWITVEPPQVSAFPYEMVEATVCFSPPRAHDVQAGTRTYALRVMSHEDVEGSVVDEATVTVGPYVDYTLRCSPLTRRGRLSGRYNVVVGNQGNAPLTVQMFADDAESALRYRFRHEEVDVPPGRGVIVPLKVRPRVRRWGGTELRHSFQCTAAAGEGERRSADLTWVQAPLIGSGVGQFLVAASAAVAALVALWFVVLRPGSSNANAPWADPSTTPSVQGTGGPTALTDPSAHRSPGGHESSDDDPSPDTSDDFSVPPDPPGDTGGSQDPTDTRIPKDIRLSASAPASGGYETSGSAQYTVEKGFRFLLTSIFLENTANDSGVLRIQRGDDTLMEVNLDALRNDPRNENASFVFGPGQKVVLAVKCTKPGALPGQSATTTCTPAATLTGSLEPVRS